MQAVRSLRSDRARAKARSLRSDRAFVSLGRYVVTELEPKLGLYVATERPFRSRPRFHSAQSLRSDRARAKARSLRSVRSARSLRSVRSARSLLSDRAYLATELRPKLGRYVATERPLATKLFQNVDTTLIHAFSSTLRCYLPKTVANPFHVFRHSTSSIKLYRKNRKKFVLYRKKP
ncbi:hypothetical protein F2Q68_00034175 [Brassica cretica]|uniref:Uncharacterized protein n=1 Tax=Brassica cretica TaxID=69181 RepID=A0A8S9GWL0_BRACR|nr:hypothetical protein F2Q68_00034175 [Brassica cretica]